MLKAKNYAFFKTKEEEVKEKQSTLDSVSENLNLEQIKQLESLLD